MLRKFLISIIFIFFSFPVMSNNKLNCSKYVSGIEKNCSVENVILKTERTEKKRKFIFWKLPHKKIITIDKVLNNNGKVIFKKTSIEICSSDACGTRKFRRIKIVENEIWIFKYNTNPEKAIIKRYDFCGKYLGEDIWDKQSFNDE